MTDSAQAETPQNIPISGSKRSSAKSPGKSPEKSPVESSAPVDNTRADNDARVLSTTAASSADSSADSSSATSAGAAAPDDAKAGRESAQSNARKRAAAGSYAPDYGESQRKATADRPNAFNPLAWLVEGATGFMDEARHGDLGLSEEFWQHFYAARRESLLTARALVDSLLEQTEKEAQRAKDKVQRAQRRGSISIKSGE